MHLHRDSTTIKRYEFGKTFTTTLGGNRAIDGTCCMHSRWEQLTAHRFRWALFFAAAFPTRGYLETVTCSYPIHHCQIKRRSRILKLTISRCKLHVLLVFLASSSSSLCIFSRKLLATFESRFGQNERFTYISMYAFTNQLHVDPSLFPCKQESKN
jgi:hypothetical protein